ncbi:hypothetical protein P154DRAFT_301302 [Amniculicola lignicola CBS 123094]|uniref:Uncharacterized protein n=1 Tax=Amniculicola lignicola CBS 123094 TaxID=1392246 RepID=A0A6A5W4Y5_9PLEO|nr:hypothetical protein P154DRAFT_301302 [Amniculicola lignicola CBS 123094]
MSSSSPTPTGRQSTAPPLKHLTTLPKALQKLWTLTTSAHTAYKAHRQRALPYKPLRPNAFFTHLHPDIRNIIYSHMILYPFSGGYEYAGLYLSCHQAKAELDVAAALAFWLYLRDFQENYSWRDSRFPRVAGCAPIFSSVQPTKAIPSSATLVGLRRLVITTPAPYFLDGGTPAFTSLYLDEVRFHVTGPAAYLALLRRHTFEPSRLALGKIFGHVRQHYQDGTLHVKEWTVSWNLSGEEQTNVALTGTAFYPRKCMSKLLRFFVGRNQTPILLKVHSEDGSMGAVSIYSPSRWIPRLDWVEVFGGTSDDLTMNWTVNGERKNLARIFDTM